MRESLKKALDDVDMMYEDIVSIANDIIYSYTKEIDTIIEEAEKNVNNFSNDQLRVLINDLSFKSFRFGDTKEKSALKSTCAETLKKEQYAKVFNESEGSVASKDNISLLASSEQIVVNCLYDLVASLFKTKLDEIHRVVDSLKTTLMSRMQEAKLTFNTAIGSPTDKTYLTE